MDAGTAGVFGEEPPTDSFAAAKQCMRGRSLLSLQAVVTE
jgi:hypothetical protein